MSNRASAALRARSFSRTGGEYSTRDSTTLLQSCCFSVFPMPSRGMPLAESRILAFDKSMEAEMAMSCEPAPTGRNGTWLGITATLIMAATLVAFGQQTAQLTGGLDGTDTAVWHPQGFADWRVEKGEIVGAVRASGGGGWLVRDRGYQDLAVKFSFRCTGDRAVGSLFAVGGPRTLQSGVCAAGEGARERAHEGDCPLVGRTPVCAVRKAPR